MTMTGFLKKEYRSLRNAEKAVRNIRFITHVRTSAEFLQDRLKSEIQRTVHQIEKGLSVEEPREGFGYEKIERIIRDLGKLTEDSPEAEQLRNRAGSCIHSFFRFYDEKGWKSEKLDTLKQSFRDAQIPFEDNPAYGGLLEIEKVTHSAEEFRTLQSIAAARHSIRDLTDEPVSLDEIKEAVSVALKAPSACNRQAVRCYVIDKSKYGQFGEWLRNIGFFGEYGFDKILLITGKITGYNENEGIQHLVSPGIFVGYLVLALEALNIGACIMQRSLYQDEKWDRVKKTAGIPDDEQSFCLIGIGKKKEQYKVPVSLRLPIDVVMKVI